jgi:hypothetical protein
VVRSLLPLEKYAQMARKLAGIKEEIQEPEVNNDGILE